jgi:hypothetical protein
MDLTEDQRRAFGVALNEATLIGTEVSVEHRGAALTVAVLSLPADDGPPPDDRRVQLRLQPVGRVAASLRNGSWDDPDAPVEEFMLDQLLDVVHELQGTAGLWLGVPGPARG